MSDQDSKQKGEKRPEGPSLDDKPKFVKPTIKISVINIDHDVFAHDTT